MLQVQMSGPMAGLNVSFYFCYKYENANKERKFDKFMQSSFMIKFKYFLKCGCDASLSPFLGIW
jgi:hypothetical protein